MHEIRPHPDLLPKRRPPEHSPCFSEMLEFIRFFERAEQRTEADPNVSGQVVVVIKFEFDM